MLNDGWLGKASKHFTSCMLVVGEVNHKMSCPFLLMCSVLFDSFSLEHWVFKLKSDHCRLSWIFFFFHQTFISKLFHWWFSVAIYSWFYIWGIWHYLPCWHLPGHWTSGPDIASCKDFSACMKHWQINLTSKISPVRIFHYLWEHLANPSVTRFHHLAFIMMIVISHHTRCSGWTRLVMNLIIRTQYSLQSVI